MVAHHQRPAVDRLRRRHACLARRGSAGVDLDDRVVCDLFRLFAGWPSVPAEKVQAELMVMSALLPKEDIVPGLR